MGQYSGPYETGDPNKPEEVIDVEAALAYQRLRRGEHPDDICKQLCLSRRTFYRRIERLILAQDHPTRSLMRVMEWENLQELTAMTLQLLEGVKTGDISNADAIKGIGEARQLSNSRRALFKLEDEEDETAPEELDAEMDEWVAEAKAEADAELQRVRNGDGSA